MHFLKKYICHKWTNLIGVREKENYSQAGLANELGISRQMYIKYESGEVEPPVSVVKGLCKIYNVPYETIIDDKLKERAKVLYLDTFSPEDDPFVAEPEVAYNSTQSLETAIENLRKLTSEKLLCATSYINYLLEKTDQDSTKKKTKSLLKYAGKIHLDKEEIMKFRTE